MVARPPLLNQLTVPDAQAREDCGETAAAIILQAGGLTDTPLEEIGDLSHDGVTSTGDLSGLIRGAGASLDVVGAALFPDALATGDAYALVLIHDNGNADPDPAGAFTHWIVGYAIRSDGWVQCVNPWGGRDITYQRSVLVSATIWAAVVRFPAKPAAPPPPPLEEIDMRLIIGPGNVGIYLLTGSAYIPLNPSGYGGLKTSGVPELTVDEAQHQRFIASSSNKGQ